MELKVLERTGSKFHFMSGHPFFRALQIFFFSEGSHVLLVIFVLKFLLLLMLSHYTVICSYADLAKSPS
jgi:hypothetical protein